MKLPAHMSHEIEALFRRMDQAYDRSAEPTGFVCRGCEDNCCLTRFYHHTLLEYLYLQRGLAGLSAPARARVRAAAETAVAQMEASRMQAESMRVMCPLNQEGRCSLYAWRPMICRLHGIPHQLRRPDGRTRTGPGCDDFYIQCPSSAGHELDRTPLYVEMAGLERQLRQHFGFNRKIKMTIAEMILDEIH